MTHGAELGGGRTGRAHHAATVRSVRIRTATAEDWPAIEPVFRTVVGAGETYAYPDDLTSEAARDLWLEQPPGWALVAVDDEGLLGTAKAGPNRPGRGAHVGTASFMVAPEASGRGVGRALGEAVLARLAAEGYRAVQFNAVVETNTRAVALWRSLGFTVVGTVPEAFDSRTHGLVGLHVMHRPL
ncbi:GNAT family N-acetyltransferase [Pseudokineococcus marinus]